MVPMEGQGGGAVGQGDRPAALILWASSPRLWLQVVLLGVILGLLLPFVLDGNGIGYPDEGLYAAQAETLSRGTWWDDRPAADLPGLEVANGLRPEFTRGNRYVGYVKHSLYIRLLVPFWRVGGFGALLLPSLVGGVLTAAAAAFLARSVDDRLAVPALWLVGVGSPLVFDSYLVAAHTLGAAAVGWTAVGLAGVLRTRRFVALLWVVPVAAFAVFMRSEGVLYVCGLSAGVGVLALMRAAHRCWRDALQLGVTAAVTFTAASVAYLVDAWLARRITGSTEAVQTTGRVLGDSTDPLPHIWASLIRPGPADRIVVAAAIGASTTLAAAVLHRALGRKSWALQSALLGVAAAATLWMHSGGLHLVTGLVAAFPLLVAGLIVMPRLGGEEARWFLVVAAVSAGVLLVLTSYAEGGAAEWGGRFYLPLVVLLGPLYVAGLAHWIEQLDRRGSLVVSLMAVGVLGLGALQVRVNHSRRSETAVIDRGVAAAVAEPDIAGQPLVVVGGVSIGGASRILWARTGEMDVLAAPSLEHTFRMVTFAAEHGYRDAFVLMPLPDGSAVQVARAWLDPIGWTVEPRRSLGATGFGLYHVHAG